MSYMLVVEDSDEDFLALQRILSKHCTVEIDLKRCFDGDEVLDFMRGEGDYAKRSNLPPNLILLDLNLPGTDGREVLRQLKADEHFRSIPIVVFTTSSNPRDIAACYQYGANSYIIKSMDIDVLKDSIRTLTRYWFEIINLPCLSTERA